MFRICVSCFAFATLTDQQRFVVNDLWNLRQLSGTGSMPFAALSIFHLASLLFAVSAGIGAYRALPDLSIHEAGFVGLCAFVLGSLFAEGAARRSERRKLLDRLDEERVERQALSRVVEDMKIGMANGQPGEANSDLVAEMRLVRSQLARLATPGIKVKSAPEAVPEPAKVVPVRRTPSPSIRLSGDALLKATTAALHENRMDLFLQPVVRLPQRRAVFHECLTRLRDDQGHMITPDQYMPIAEQAGMTSAIDNLSLFRCIQTLKARRGPDLAEVTFFCNLSPATLDDSEFFDQFVDFLAANRDLAGRIVFEMEARQLLDAHGRTVVNLDRLTMLGYRLSADHVTSLDMDLPELARRGASFIKIDCSALLGDMARSTGAVREALSTAGVTLIASKVEREEQVVELVEAEVSFAQGYLFGEPRPMREDAWRIAEAS
jgi:cyclic-di-GMP phosphodiesterase TipF (flagellum assembly factor)